MMFSKGNKADFLNTNRQKNNMNMESSHFLHKIYCSSSSLLQFAIIRVLCLCFNSLSLERVAALLECTACAQHCQ